MAPCALPGRQLRSAVPLNTGLPQARQTARHRRSRPALLCMALDLHLSTASASSSRSGAGTLVKICGITSPADAELAAAAGADMIGMIIWPKTKRAVSESTARDIARVARQHGAQAVGVFVDEDASTIARLCEATGITVAQLHGGPSRQALAELQSMQTGLQVVYVLHANAAGELQTPMPESLAESSGQQLQRPVDWLLIDGMQGGSGEAFDWSNLRAPAEGASMHGWVLAGGLGPHNVAEAVRIACPTAVDVSSGVAGLDGLAKDRAKVVAFLEAVKGLGGSTR